MTRGADARTKLALPAKLIFITDTDGDTGSSAKRALNATVLKVYAIDGDYQKKSSYLCCAANEAAEQLVTAAFFLSLKCF